MTDISESRSTNHLHATFKSPTAASGYFHMFGFYEAPAADADLTNAAPTQTLGTANNPYSAHVFIVAKEAGAASGGSTGTAKITITGTSISTAGVRTTSDAEILVADVTALSANQYVESSKMFLGQVTLTLATTGDRTTFSATVNYGFASAQHFWEKNVMIKQIEYTGRGGATDTGFNFELLHHKGSGDTGWTYNATAFVPGGTAIVSMGTDLSTECDLASGKRFHYHRKGLKQLILGASGEGIVARVTTSANNAVESSDCRIQYSLI